MSFDLTFEPKRSDHQLTHPLAELITHNGHDFIRCPSPKFTPADALNECVGIVENYKMTLLNKELLNYPYIYFLIEFGFRRRERCEKQNVQSGCERRPHTFHWFGTQKLINRDNSRYLQFLGSILAQLRGAVARLKLKARIL